MIITLGIRLSPRIVTTIFFTLRGTQVETAPLHRQAHIHGIRSTVEQRRDVTGEGVLLDDDRTGRRRPSVIRDSRNGALPGGVLGDDFPEIIYRRDVFIAGGPVDIFVRGVVRAYRRHQIVGLAFIDLQGCPFQRDAFRIDDDVILVIHGADRISPAAPGGNATIQLVLLQGHRKRTAAITGWIQIGRQ